MAAGSTRVLVMIFAAIFGAPGYVSTLSMKDKMLMADKRAIPIMAYSTGNRLIQSEVDDMVPHFAVEKAFKAGFRHIVMPADYNAVEGVGTAVRFSYDIPRKDVFITAKLSHDALHRHDVVRDLKKTLKILKLDYVNLFLIDWPIGKYKNGTIYEVDYLKTWKGMMKAKKRRLTRSIGVANFNQTMIERILRHGLEVPAALQIEVNINLQQEELRAFCKSKGIAVIGYAPFGSLREAQVGAPPPREHDLEELAQKHNKKVMQIALRYALELGVIPIVETIAEVCMQGYSDIFDIEFSPDEKQLLKSYDAHYRTYPFYEWHDYKYYPFEKNPEEKKRRDKNHFLIPAYQPAWWEHDNGTRLVPEPEPEARQM